MGKSKGIEEKEKANQEFRAFMDTLQAEAKVREDGIQQEVDALVAKHYNANKWDHARLFGNRQSDYQNYDDWSLDRIVKITESIGNALKGGNFPSAAVPGSKEAEKSTVDEAKEFIASFAGDYDLVIARVQAMVSAVLSQFSVASSVSQKAVLKDMPLSGGLHLFFGSMGSVYQNQKFFSNQYIGSFQIVFETYMSVKEAQTIGLQQILATTEYELNVLNSLIISIRDAQKKSLTEILKNNPQDYTSTYATYKLALDITKADRDVVEQKYNEYNSAVEAVDTVYAQLALPGASGAAPTGTLALETLFSGKQLEVAQRYVREKQAALAPA
ncbi:hypothetical protein [Hymenobacter cheonanensis]|uniref:hypothetical protein n=1 Tax=Hymenobacter sp. CA2-7 TaxID=3063993 RepID=UPI00271384CD|nr:hypothetical protein [Hymenobacter sp. CA2-7]MDO7885713.1 hypothetical protein [Hymenobacter sp. CA2-7]